jgi:hypothetical protein
LQIYLRDFLDFLDLRRLPPDIELPQPALTALRDLRDLRDFVVLRDFLAALDLRRLPPIESPRD